jgi:thioesterase domain-containing protein
MAVQLLDQGCEVGLLAIIDQRKPGWRLTFREALPVLHRILLRMPGRIRDEWVETPPTRRIKSLRRTLVKWFGAALGYRANAVSMFNINRDETKLIALFEANLKSLRAYRPKKLRAPMTLFRASRQSVSHAALDSTLGWRDLAVGGLQIRNIEGNHGSILKDPQVRELAKMVSDELDAAVSASGCFSAR